MKISRKWKKIAIVAFGMFGLSTLSFNCSPSLFQAKDFSSVSAKGVTPITKFDEPKSPYVLMTSKQVFNSMLNLTGQANRKTDAQQTEYLARMQSMADTSNLASVNAPMQLSITSLAGEVCRKVINDEKSGALPRNLFTGVDFTKGPSGQAAGYTVAVSKMARTFWGRDVSENEGHHLTTFFQEFTAGVADTAAETDKLYLATCAAMLASFDATTF